MKKEIHPKYEKVTIKCACGNEFDTQSTKGGEMHVELCSTCHPFFTGKQKFIDTAGRVDKFQARLKAAEAKKQASKKSSKNAGSEEKVAASNAEKLAEIKAQVVAEAEPSTFGKGAAEKPSTDLPKKPMTVTQEANSDVELAAEEELAEAKNN